MVRKHLSATKGGRLAAAAPRSMKLTFAISDVPQGEESALASGPTLPDPTTIHDAERIIAECSLLEKLPSILPPQPSKIINSAKAPKKAMPPLRGRTSNYCSARTTCSMPRITPAKRLDSFVFVMLPPTIGRLTMPPTICWVSWKRRKRRIPRERLPYWRTGSEKPGHRQRNGRAQLCLRTRVRPENSEAANCSSERRYGWSRRRIVRGRCRC